MTERQLYDNILSELNKVEAPSILLEDFIYFANKGVQQYVNKVYNRYDINQQSSDDLRALKETVQLEVGCDPDIALPTEDVYWFSYLPKDYLHLLNCIVVFKKRNSNLESTCKKSKEKNIIKSFARRLTSDMYPNIINNVYFKPSYKVPYYFITNLTVDKTNSRLQDILYPCDFSDFHFLDTKLEQLFHPCEEISDTDKSNIKLEIKCGSNEKYVPISVYVDYIRIPKPITLTYDQLESEIDTTRVLEFPEYVCYEIVNDCVKLIMENESDPRLETNTAINQTIGTNVSQNK